MAQRSKSQKRSERQRRKEYEKEHPDLGGYIWQAITISLVGCLFCAGRNWEKKVEEAKASTGQDSSENRSPVIEDSDRDRDREHHHRRHRRSRAGSDIGDRDRGYIEDARERRSSRGYDRGIGLGSVSGSVRGASVRGGSVRGGGSVMDDPRVSYIPVERDIESRYRASDDGTTRWVVGEDMYEVEEPASPAPRRRRVTRDESFA